MLTGSELGLYVCCILELSNPTVIVEKPDEDKRSKFNLDR